MSTKVQAETIGSVTLGFVDQRFLGPKPAAAAKTHGIAPVVIKALEAKREFVLLCQSAGS